MRKSMIMFSIIRKSGAGIPRKMNARTLASREHMWAIQ